MIGNGVINYLNMKKMNLTNQELSILHRAIKVYHIDLIEKEIDLLLDYPDALESVRIKIKEAYEKES